MAARSSPAPTVLIAGVGPSYRRLAAQAAVARAPVILVGQRDDVGDLLHAADVAVVAGRRGGPPASSRRPWRPGRRWSAPPVGACRSSSARPPSWCRRGDVDAVDEAVRGLLADPGERARLAAAGPARARSWPTDGEAADQVLGVYAELVARRRS